MTLSRNVSLFISAVSAGWCIYWASLIGTAFYFVCGRIETTETGGLFIIDVCRIVLSCVLFMSPFVSLKPLQSLPLPLLSMFQWTPFAFAGVAFTAVLLYYINEPNCPKHSTNDAHWEAEVTSFMNQQVLNFNSLAIRHMYQMYNPLNWCESRITALTQIPGVSFQHCLRYGTGKFNIVIDSAIWTDICFDAIRLVGAWGWAERVRAFAPKISGYGYKDFTASNANRARKTARISF